MPEPDEVRFACIGCGALNPVGAEVCSGCGHRFAGPDSFAAPGPARGLSPTPRPAFAPREPSYQPERSPVVDALAAFGGCLLRLFALLAVIVVALVSFGIAFFVTCSVVQDGSAVFLAFMAGGAAAVLAGSLAVAVIRPFFRDDSNKYPR